MTWYHSRCDWHSTDDQAEHPEPWGLVKAIVVLSMVTLAVLVVVVICLANWS
jgi:heme/copper-type cytochrome/quinol oxidase subunit 2